MIDPNEIILSTHDAATLSAMIATLSPREPLLPDAADELVDVLAGAKLVAPSAFDDDVVGLGAHVTYVEVPGGPARTVQIVHPSAADASAARISVFAPVGRALLGRRTGSHVPVALPDNRIDALHVVAVRRAGSVS